MPRKAAPFLFAVLVAVASIFGLVAAPATGAPPNSHVDYVVVAGAAGLRWDDINPTDTPTLWKLAGQGSIGALSVRSARTPTCPGDGWLTLGAGSYAQQAKGQVTDQCPPTSVDIQRPDSIGANLPDQEGTVAALNRAQPYGTQPGALAEAVRCTTAVGPGAAIAAARPYGRVDRYEPTLPADPAALLSSCVLSIVDLGTINGSTPATRRAQARAADATLAKVVAARPPAALLMVAGLADTDTTSRLHVAIADGPGYQGGWLTSNSTDRRGYLQLTDLAPTALTALGKAQPTKLFTGQAADNVGGRPSDVADAVSHFADADREARAQSQVAGWFFAIVVVLDLLLFIAVIPLLRRARRFAGPHGAPPLPPRLVHGAEVLLAAASLVVPGALIADLVPWWRTDSAGLFFALVTVAVVGVLTALVTLGPWWRGALGPLGAVGGIAAAIIGLDVLTGSRLQLNGVAGYSVLAGSRYAGLGTIGLGVFITGILLTGGVLAQRLARNWRPVVIALTGGIGVVLVGSPYLGANAGGAVALTAGVCVAAAISTGGFVTFARLAWATLAGIAVTTAFALLDLDRPVNDRGSLGRFLTAANDGTSGAAVHRTSTANGMAVFNSPLTILVIAAGIMALFVLLRPWGGLKRLFGIYPTMRAALTGVTVAGLLAGFLNGVAFNVAGAAAATAMPLAALAALRVLDHADDRTTASPGRPDTPPAVPAAPQTPAQPLVVTGVPEPAVVAGAVPPTAVGKAVPPMVVPPAVVPPTVVGEAVPPPVVDGAAVGEVPDLVPVAPAVSPVSARLAGQPGGDRHDSPEPARPVTPEPVRRDPPVSAPAGPADDVLP